MNSSPARPFPIYETWTTTNASRKGSTSIEGWGWKSLVERLGKETFEYLEDTTLVSCGQGIVWAKQVKWSRVGKKSEAEPIGLRNRRRIWEIMADMEKPASREGD